MHYQYKRHETHTQETIIKKLDSIDEIYSPYTPYHFMEEVKKENNGQGGYYNEITITFSCHDRLYIPLAEIGVKIIIRENYTTVSNKRLYLSPALDRRSIMVAEVFLKLDKKLSKQMKKGIITL